MIGNLDHLSQLQGKSFKECNVDSVVKGVALGCLVVNLEEEEVFASIIDVGHDVGVVGR